MHREIVNICKSKEEDAVHSPSFGVSTNENGNDAGRSAGNRPGCFICPRRSSILPVQCLEPLSQDRLGACNPRASHLR